METLPLELAHQKISALKNNMEKIIKGKNIEIDKVLTCLLADGHILVEDNPGTGKTSMAKTLANSISKNTTKNDQLPMFKRIQFTPDLLPMDLIGIHIFDDRQKEFVFKKGPLFSNIILADEINRASPKVQSALLECMAEKQISIGEKTHKLENVFFVIATQNPIEMQGTYPLPAAQLDRFFMKISIGYASQEIEMDILNNYLFINNIEENVKPVISIEEVNSLQNFAEGIFVHPKIVESVNNIANITRDKTNGFELGASTRAAIIFIKCLKAFALISGRDYVIEDDLKHLATDILHHRLIYLSKQDEISKLDELINDEINKLSYQKLELNKKN